MKAVNTVLKREENKVIVTERRKEEGSSQLGERLATARQIPFLFGFIALILSAIGLSAQVILAKLPYFYWYSLSSMVRTLPMTSLIVAFLSSTSYLFLSVAARLAGAKEIDERRPWLTRFGFWSTVLTGLVATITCAAAGVVFVGGWSSVPRYILDTYYAQRYFKIAAFVITGGFPFAWLLSGSCLALGANLIGQRSQLRALPALEENPIPSDTNKPELVLLEGAKSQANCPVCGCNCDEEPRVCTRCHTPHHYECWDYSGGCAIFGCDEKRWRQPAISSDLAPLRQKVERWITLYKGHWYSLCAAVGGTVLVMGSVTLPVWGYRLPTVLQAITRVASSIQSAGVLLAIGGILTYIFINILERLSRKELKDAVNLQEPAVGSESREVVDRLDESSDENGLYSLLFSSIGFLISVAILFAYVRHSFPNLNWHISYAQAAAFLAMGVAFPAALYSASRARLAYIGSLQNRLAASLKKGEDF